MMGHLRWILTLLFSTWITTCLTEKYFSEIKSNHLDRCIEKQTCQKCIQTPDCAWCSMPEFNYQRCFHLHVNRMITEKCPVNYIFNPSNDYLKVRLQELTKGGSTKLGRIAAESEEKEAVHIYPQEIMLRLRINEVQKFKIVFVQNEDYPSLEMKHNASNYVNLKYYSNSLELGPFNKNGSLNVRREVEFMVEIEVPACPKNPAEWKQKFLISPVGLANESLTVNLEMICDCNCDAAGSSHFEVNSERCYGQGNLTCGVCSCHDGFFGNHCECRERSYGSGINMKSGCRPDDTIPVDCSGRGYCICNEVCACFPRQDPTEVVWGKYCECDNFSCDRRNRMLCSGNGVCNCGVCECRQGWSGKACECSTDKKDCYDNVTGLECSGHGVCECGKCICDSEDEHRRYSGKVCNVTTDV